MIFMISIQIPMNSNEFKARVIDIKDYNITVSNYGRRVKIQTQYFGTLDDIIWVEAQDTTQNPTNQDDTQRVIKVLKGKEIKLIKKGKSIRAMLFSKYSEHPFLRSVLFNQFHDSLPMISSLSLHFSGILLLSDLLSKKFINKEKQSQLKKFISIAYLFVFGISFSALRIFLKQWIKSEKQIVILLILFPMTGQNFAFLYPFSRTIMGMFHENLKKLHAYALFPILSLLSQFRFNLIEFFLFPLMRYIMGIVFMLALILPSSAGILESVLSLLFSFTNSFNRLIILGKPSSLSLLLIILLLIFNKQRMAYYTLLASILFMIYPLSYRITYIDVGQGDSTLIQYPFNAHTILIDTGKGSAKYLLEKSLRKNGVNRIDTLIITHDDEDHYGNLEILRSMSKEIIEDKNKKVMGLSELLSHKYYSQDDNANSLVYYLKIKDIAFLFLGDAGKEQELDILKEHPNLNIDILKLGHHGSKTSTDEFFVKSIKPRYAIASSKPQVYGHPHKEVKRVLHNNRVKLLETSVEGDIQFVFTFIFDFIRTDAGGFGIMK